MIHRLPILILFISASTSWSQTVFIEGGSNFSHIDAKYDPSYMTPSDSWDMGEFPNYFSKTYIGWDICLGIDYRQRNRSFLSSSVGLVQNGSKGDEKFQPDGFPIMSKKTVSVFRFIKLNTLFNLRLNSSEKWIIHAGLGPEVNYMIKHDLYESTLVTLNNLEENLNTVLFGLTGKFGVKYNIESLQFGLNVGYNYNFNYLLNHTASYNAYPDHTVNYTMKMNNLSSNITIGYNF